jgi:hypothetical protein
MQSDIVLLGKFSGPEVNIDGAVSNQDGRDNLGLVETSAKGKAIA